MLDTEFFASLYETQPATLAGDFDAAVTRLVSKQGDKIVAGDQALQALMINYVTATPENAAKGNDIAAALGGIKMFSVESFVNTFPGIGLDQLLAEAEKAGHKVEVLKS